MPLDAPSISPTLAKARDYLARGMSEEAVRLALGIRARDWPGICAQVRGDMIAAEPAAAKEQPVVHPVVAELRPVGVVALTPQNGERRRQLTAETIDRPLSAKQAQMVEKAAPASVRRGRDLLPRVPRDTIRDQAALLRTVVLQESGVTLTEFLAPHGGGKKSPSARVRHYACWLLRTHVPSITVGEISVFVNRNAMTVYGSIRFADYRLRRPHHDPEMLELHLKVRARIEEAVPCAACERILAGQNEATS